MLLSFEIFILARDRVDFLELTLKSFLQDQRLSCRLTVSDNSTDLKVYKLAKTNFPEINYIRRNNLNSRDHFISVISDITAEYVMIFHDDDIISPRFFQRIEEILKEMRANGYKLCGFNANVINEEGKFIRIYNDHLKNNKEISSAKEIINSYIDSSVGSIPFPSYIYESQTLKKFQFGDEGTGKYSDVVLLLKVLSEGKALWISEPLMEYRIHSSNDSGTTDEKSVKILSDYFIKLSPELKINVLDFYYMHSIMDLIKKKKYDVILSALLFYVVNSYLIFKRIFYKIRRNLS